MGDSGRRQRRGKVERLVEQYGLQAVGEELQRLWTAPGGDRRSLRDLADYFNRHLVEAALAESDSYPLDLDPDRLYRQLSSDDASSAERTRGRKRLEGAGIDVDDLESNFVSHEAIRTYLRHNDVTRPDEETDQLEKEAERIRKLRSRTVAVSESKLDQLRSTDRLTLGDFRVLAELQVFCEECESQFGIDALLERGGCDCERP